MKNPRNNKIFISSKRYEEFEITEGRFRHRTCKI